MDLLDRLLGHDAWTTRQLLLRSLNLADEQLDQEFDIGHRTLRATFVHLIRNMEGWSGLMAGEKDIIFRQGRSITELMERLDRAAATLVSVARSVAERNGWDVCASSIISTIHRPRRRMAAASLISLPTACITERI